MNAEYPHEIKTEAEVRALPPSERRKFVPIPQACRWECRCGAKNYADLIEVDLQEDAFPEALHEQVRDMRDAGMDAELTGLMAPTRATCSACGVRVRLKDRHQQEEGGVTDD